MSDPNVADWLGGVGQAIEAVVVLYGLWFARDEVRRFVSQRQLGTDGARATAAVDVWDTVVRAVDIIESLYHQPIEPGTNDYVRKQLEAWSEHISNAVEGLNRSLGRSTLLLGDTHIGEDLTMLSKTLLKLAAIERAMRYPKSMIVSYPAEPTALASEKDVEDAQGAMARVLRKLNAVALRKLPVPE